MAVKVVMDQGISRVPAVGVGAFLAAVAGSCRCRCRPRRLRDARSRQRSSEPTTVVLSQPASGVTPLAVVHVLNIVPFFVCPHGACR